MRERDDACILGHVLEEACAPCGIAHAFGALERAMHSSMKRRAMTVPDNVAWVCTRAVPGSRTSARAFYAWGHRQMPVQQAGEPDLFGRELRANQGAGWNRHCVAPTGAVGVGQSEIMPLSGAPPS